MKSSIASVHLYLTLIQLRLSVIIRPGFALQLLSSEYAWLMVPNKEEATVKCFYGFSMINWLLGLHKEKIRSHFIHTHMYHLYDSSVNRWRTPLRDDYFDRWWFHVR